MRFAHQQAELVDNVGQLVGTGPGPGLFEGVALMGDADGCGYRSAFGFK